MERSVLDRIKRSDVLLHGAIVFGGILVANIFSYLFYMLIGRRAGIVVYGEVTSLVSAMLVVGAPANVLQLISARLAAELDARGDRPALRKLADIVALRTGLVAIVGVVISWFFRESIAQFFNLRESAPVVATAAALALFWIACAQRGVLQGAHRFEQYAVSISIEALIKVVLGVTLVVKYGATGAITGGALGLAFAVAYNLIVIQRSFGKRRAAVRFERAALVKIVSGVGLGQFTLTVLMFYDVPLVKHAFDARAAGLYAAAALVGRAVIGIIAFVPTIVLPKATERMAMGRSPIPLFAATMGLAVAAVMVALAAGALAPTFVVTTIAGRDFAAAAPLVLLYLVASSTLSLATVVASYNFGLHRYKFVLPVTCLALLEIIVLALWHPTVTNVVTVLAVGHTMVLAATLYRINAPIANVEPLQIELEPFQKPDIQTIG